MKEKADCESHEVFGGEERITPIISYGTRSPQILFPAGRKGYYPKVDNMGNIVIGVGRELTEVSISNEDFPPHNYHLGEEGRFPTFRDLFRPSSQEENPPIIVGGFSLRRWIKNGEVSHYHLQIYPGLRISQGLRELIEAAPRGELSFN